MKPLKMRPDGLSEADHRSLLAIERAAKEILTQCSYLRRNAAHSGDDCLRFILIHNYSKEAVSASQKALTRYYKIRGCKSGKAGQDV